MPKLTEIPNMQGIHFAKYRVKSHRVVSQIVAHPQMVPNNMGPNLSSPFRYKYATRVSTYQHMFGKYLLNIDNSHYDVDFITYM